MASHDRSPALSTYNVLLRLEYRTSWSLHMGFQFVIFQSRQTYHLGLWNLCLTLSQEWELVVTQAAMRSWV